MSKPSPSPSPVLLGGSRSLPACFAPLVAQVVAAVLAAGNPVSVGCAAGADQLALQAALALAPAQLRVFCVGSSAGAGFWSGSAPLALLRQAAQAGAVVSWQAGGSPAVPFRARLLRRSLAALAGCSAAVFLLASPSSPGSLRVAAAAAKAGIPVFVFCCGFSGSPAPLAGIPGAWQPALFCGLPCFSWQPPAAQLSLF